MKRIVVSMLLAALGGPGCLPQLCCKDCGRGPGGHASVPPAHPAANAPAVTPDQVTPESARQITQALREELERETRQQTPPDAAAPASASPKR